MFPGPVALTVGMLVIVLVSTALLIYVLVKASEEGHEEQKAREELRRD